MTTATEHLTVKLNNGCEVAAKLYKGEPTALGYTNRTSANTKAAALGADWAVYQFNRVFYVGRIR
jgi:hypothetical protein